MAQTQGGRAEIRLLSGDASLALRELEEALATHRKVGNVVGEANDLRVRAAVMVERGEARDADLALRDVIERADRYARPLLAAQGERDLARLLQQLGRCDEAGDFARRARARFKQLGAEVEVRNLDHLNGLAGS